MRVKKINLKALIVIVFALYILTANAVYRYNHPKQTETELAINFWKALTWRD